MILPKYALFALSRKACDQRGSYGRVIQLGTVPMMTEPAKDTGAVYRLCNLFQLFSQGYVGVELTHVDNTFHFAFAGE